MTSDARPAGGIDATMAAMETAALASPESDRLWIACDYREVSEAPSVRDIGITCDWPAHIGVCSMERGITGTVEEALRNATCIAASCPANVLAVLAHARSETARADAERQAREAAERERNEARKAFHKLHREAQAREGKLIRAARRRERDMWMYLRSCSASHANDSQIELMRAMSAAEDRADALQAKVEALIVALRPLAEVGGSYTVQTLPEDYIFTLANEKAGRITGLHARHLRTAARLLADHDREAAQAEGGDHHG